MSCHSSAAMQLFIVKLLSATIIITGLSVPEVSGQTNLTDTTPAPMKNNGEYKSNCDPLKPSNCAAPLVCERSQCDCDKGSVWSPTKKLCKLKVGSTCTRAEDCTDYANCVQQSALHCLGCGHHHYPPVVVVHRPHPHDIDHDHSAVYATGRSGDDRPKPPQCHCKHGPGDTDGTCSSSGAGADKHISPSFMLFTGTLLIVSRKALNSCHYC